MIYLFGSQCFSAALAADNDAQPQASGLEAIVVTARKASESLLEVPVTVSVVSASSMQNHDVTDLFKLAELVPEVMVGQVSSGTGALLSIRGIGSSPLDAGIDQSVSVDIDGTQISRGRVITQALFDLQQAEILEGPQALFFGKNSPAGVISLHSADPTRTLEGYTDGGYEFEAREWFADGAISGPISDTLSARLAFRADGMRGWIDRTSEPIADPFYGGITAPGSQGEQPGTHDYAVRLSTKWSPWEDFDAMLKILVDQQTMNSGGGYSQTFCGPGETSYQTFGVVDPYGNCDRNRMATAGSALPPQFAVNLPYANGGVPYQLAQDVVSSLNLNKRFENFSLASTTGAYWYTVQDANAADNSSYTTIFNAEMERYRLFSEELRATSNFAGPVNFTVGGYIDRSYRYHYGGPFFFLDALNPVTSNYAAFQEVSENTGNTYSGFGQVRWKIISSMELAAGARYTRETKSTDIGNDAVNPKNPLGVAPAGYFVNGNYSDSNVSPEASLTWHPSLNQTLYLAYKTGYKSGGFSDVATLPPGSTPESLMFKREESKGEELGYKGELLDRNMRVSLTAYHYRYYDLQVSAFDPITISYNIANAASAQIQGFEGNLVWAAMSGFTVNGAFSYNDGKFLSFPNAECYSSQTAATGCIGGEQNLGGHQLIRAPRWSFNFGGDYEMPVAAGWAADLSADADYSSSYNTSDTEDPATIQPSFWRLNAALHIHPTDRHLDFAIVGRNLTNEYSMVFSQGRPGGGAEDFIGFFNRPREVLLQAQYRF
jgi:iron complex outermembrane recepter protein